MFIFPNTLCLQLHTFLLLLTGWSRICRSKNRLPLNFLHSLGKASCCVTVKKKKATGIIHVETGNAELLLYINYSNYGCWADSRSPLLPSLTVIQMQQQSVLLRKNNDLYFNFSTETEHEWRRTFHQKCPLLATEINRLLWNHCLVNPGINLRGSLIFQWLLLFKFKYMYLSKYCISYS